MILTLRDRLRKLFTKLINSKDDEEKIAIIAEFKDEKQKLLNEATDNDFDTINTKELTKYERMNIVNNINLSPEEK